MLNLFYNPHKHIKVGEYWIHRETPEWYAIIEKIENGRFVHYQVFGDGEPKTKSVPYPVFLDRYEHFPPMN